MAREPVIWLATTVRLLLRRVEVLEGKLRAEGHQNQQQEQHHHLHGGTVGQSFSLGLNAVPISPMCDTLAKKKKKKEDGVVADMKEQFVEMRSKYAENDHKVQRYPAVLQLAQLVPANFRFDPRCEPFVPAVAPALHVHDSVGDHPSLCDEENSQPLKNSPAVLMTFNVEGVGVPPTLGSNVVAGDSRNHEEDGNDDDDGDCDGSGDSAVNDDVAQSIEAKGDSQHPALVGAQAAEGVGCSEAATAAFGERHEAVGNGATADLEGSEVSSDSQDEGLEDDISEGRYWRYMRPGIRQELDSLENIGSLACVYLHGHVVVAAERLLTRMASQPVPVRVMAELAGLTIVKAWKKHDLSTVVRSNYDGLVSSLAEVLTDTIMDELTPAAGSLP